MPSDKVRKRRNKKKRRTRGKREAILLVIKCISSINHENDPPPIDMIILALKKRFQNIGPGLTKLLSEKGGTVGYESDKTYTDDQLFRFIAEIGINNYIAQTS